jgi:hypothetical protein
MKSDLQWVPQATRHPANKDAHSVHRMPAVNREDPDGPVVNA